MQPLKHLFIGDKLFWNSAQSWAYMYQIPCCKASVPFNLKAFHFKETVLKSLLENPARTLLPIHASVTFSHHIFPHTAPCWNRACLFVILYNANILCFFFLPFFVWSFYHVYRVLLTSILSLYSQNINQSHSSVSLSVSQIRKPNQYPHFQISN